MCPTNTTGFGRKWFRLEKTVQAQIPQRGVRLHLSLPAGDIVVEIGFSMMFVVEFWGFPCKNFSLTPNADLRRKRKWTRKLTLVQLWTTLPQIPMCVSYRQNDGHAHPYRIDSSNSDSGNNPNLPVSRVVVNCCITF